MKHENTQQHCADSPDACPDRISDADGDGLSGFRQKNGTQNIEECETSYPSPELCPDSKFGLTEAEGEG